MCPDGLNPETAFVLRRFGLPAPPMSTNAEFVGRPVGLVDVSSVGQVAQGVDMQHVLFVADHHMLADDLIESSMPIYGDWRPWGSASTIITFKFLESGTPLPNASIAGLLSAAIVSDTINLQSGTTTDYDREALRLLSMVSGLSQSSLDQLAYDMFQAKSNVENFTVDQIIRLDYKKYSMGDDQQDNSTVIRVGWASAETVRLQEYIANSTQFFDGLRAVKLKDKLDLIFMGPVDLNRLTSVLLLCCTLEAKVARAVYNGTIIQGQDWANTIMNTSKRVSRKIDFIPDLDAYLSQFASLADLERALEVET